MQLQTALGDVEFDFVAIADKGERSAVAFSNNNSRGCRRVCANLRGSRSPSYESETTIRM